MIILHTTDLQFVRPCSVRVKNDPLLLKVPLGQGGPLSWAHRARARRAEGGLLGIQARHHQRPRLSTLRNTAPQLPLRDTGVLRTDAVSCKIHLVGPHVLPITAKRG